MNTAVLFSSATDEWETPQAFFNTLDVEFGFALDVAATIANAKVRNQPGRPSFFGPDNHDPEFRDALSFSWADMMRSFGMLGRACWMNPPYSRGLQAAFIVKAAYERRRGVLTVALLPARTDTQAFHAHIYDASKWQPREGIEIRLLKGRLKFGGAKNSAPFPSMIVVFRP